jgi:DNA (cytosine-5)-methyltransferase 1
MKPLTSVRSVLRSIPENHPDHNVDAVGKLNLAPWDDSGICKRAITTHGGQNYHPSGKRHLTNREFACLQGFPLEHRFSTTHVKKQIGNAVPPFVAKILFKAVVKALREADGLEPEEPDIIDLDGDAPDELDVIHLEEMTLEQPAKMNVVNDKSESPEVIDLEDADKEQPEVIHPVNDRPESPELIELETEMREVVIIG